MDSNVKSNAFTKLVLHLLNAAAEKPTFPSTKSDTKTNVAMVPNPNQKVPAKLEGPSADLYMTATICMAVCDCKIIDHLQRINLLIIINFLYNNFCICL